MLITCQWLLSCFSLPTMARWSETNHFRHHWLSHVHRNTLSSQEPSFAPGWCSSATPSAPSLSSCSLRRVSFNSWSTFLTHLLPPFTHLKYMIAPHNCMSCPAPWNSLWLLRAVLGHVWAWQPYHQARQTHAWFPSPPSINKVHLITRFVKPQVQPQY